MTRKRESFFVVLLMCYIIIQPLLDLIWLNNGVVGEVFGFTIPTLVRVLGIAILGIMSFGIVKFRKSHIWIILYILAIGVYFVIHHINAMHFNSFVEGDFNYSLVSELFYIVRMCIPMAIIFFVYNSNFSKTHFDICVISLGAFIAFLVCITNLMEISVASYSNDVIAGNIIDWFVNPGAYYYNQLASKGFFFSSIVSMVLILVLPYTFYLYTNTEKINYLLLLCVESIALFMFGTKATSYSCIIVSSIMILLYIFFVTIIKKNKFKLSVLISLLLVCLGGIWLLDYSPAVSRVQYDHGYANTIDQNEELLIEENEDENSYQEYDFSKKEDIILFFKNNHKLMSINQTILTEKYTYEDDPEFWLDLYENTVPSQRMNNRFIQEKVLQRVKDVSNNSMDQFFGIGYSRTSNIYNLEKDFLYQYYSMGLVGAVLLVGPYIAILFFIICNVLMRLKERANLCICALVLGCGLVCCLAYYSGNTLETLGITIVLGMVYGYSLKVISSSSDVHN